MMDRKGLVQKNTLQIFDLQRLVSLIAASMYVLCPTFRINNNNNNNLLLIRRKYLYEYIQMRLTSYIKIIIK